MLLKKETLVFVNGKNAVCIIKETWMVAGEEGWKTCLMDGAFAHSLILINSSLIITESHCSCVSMSLVKAYRKWEP